ncbi:acyltransferase [Hymenobacter fodinae]|uniref:Acyltransferase n=1 Tax=Hymenobacter fodinae TaxID=2510796 RepID=A0A4Z0NZR4_9BACT|nr:acyltransferase [Hymenobacter fodinae]TGE04310.1 acyltransferase [Hymenobacter fodinae]
MFRKAVTCILPWSIKRRALHRWFGFELHPTAHIGLAWIFPRRLTMGAGARIDHFTVAIHLDAITMEANATIGRGNWITGFPTRTQSPHFQHQPSRRAELILGESAAVTKDHHLDCTNLLEIGRFATIAGYRSQFLTHSINLFDNRQGSEPIRIGAYTFVGTNVVVLGGSVLPAYCVLGAKSLLNKAYEQEWKLYAGVPAKAVGEIPPDAKYFSRTEGFVY